MNQAKNASQINTERLTTLKDNKNPKQLAIRMVVGFFLLVLSVLFMIRVPYFGEFFDGIFFDLLFFGTAKYFFYLWMIAVSFILFWYQKNYWRLLLTKRFILFNVLVFSGLSLIFAIVNYYQNWVNVPQTTISSYYQKYFEVWKSQVWVSGNFVWTTGVFINGGLWWTLIAGINAGVPAVLLFLLLAIIVVLILLAIGLKLHWKKLEWIRKKTIVWLGGFYENIKNKNNRQDKTLAKEPSTPFINPYLRQSIDNNLDKSNKQISPYSTEQNQSNLLDQTVPFSLEQSKKTNLAYNYPISGISENNFDKNNEFAKNAMLDLTDFFIFRSIKASPEKYVCGPSLISIYWKLEDPSSINELIGYKNEIQTTLKVPKFDVYLKNNILEIQIPVPYANKICFKEINDVIWHSLSLNCAIGWNTLCQPWTINLNDASAVLLTGTQGSGKGMLLSAMVLSLVINHSPSQLLLAAVDTRSSHLSKFEGIKHLVSPVANTISGAIALFEKILIELKFRVSLLRKTSASSINEYNTFPETTQAIQPLIIVINDLQDLLDYDSEYTIKFLTAIYTHSQRLNISIILSTNEISDLIVHKDLLKIYNTIFAFKCSEVRESEILLNKNYLAKLYGNGDFIMFNPNSSKKQISRGITCYIDKNEFSKIIENLKGVNYEKNKN